MKKTIRKYPFADLKEIGYWFEVTPEPGESIQKLQSKVSAACVMRAKSPAGNGEKYKTTQTKNNTILVERIK